MNEAAFLAAAVNRCPS